MQANSTINLSWSAYSIKIKLLLLALLMSLIFLLIIAYDRSSQLKKLSYAKRDEITLKRNFLQQQKIYATVEHTQKKIKQMSQYYKDQLNTLPPQSKIDRLLQAISQHGTQAGLKFVHFKPQKTIDKNFYTIMPINIAVQGNYHQLAHFISELGNFKQLVTVNNFVLSRDPEQANMLTMNLVINVYRRTKA